MAEALDCCCLVLITSSGCTMQLATAPPTAPEMRWKWMNWCFNCVGFAVPPTKWTIASWVEPGVDFALMFSKKQLQDSRNRVSPLRKPLSVYFLVQFGMSSYSKKSFICQFLFFRDASRMILSSIFVLWPFQLLQRIRVHAQKHTVNVQSAAFKDLIHSFFIEVLNEAFLDPLCILIILISTNIMKLPTLSHCGQLGLQGT